MSRSKRKRPFLGELKRRQVLKVGATYLVVAFVVLQVVDLLVEPLRLPEVTMTVVIVLMAAGFPVAVAMAWAFELTDEGLVSDERARASREASLPAEVVAGAEAVAPAPERSIAVLPFTNLTGDADNEYFSDGVTEEIINVLSRIHELQVISRTSVMRFRTTDRSVGDIAGELGVRNVLEGSVRRAGERVRISAQLIDAANDRHLWAERYDRQLEDIFAIQSDVARRIAAALAAELSPQENDRLDRRPTDDVEAWELYLKGRHLWNRRTEESLRRSLDYFDDALARDPEFALAQAGKADTWFILGLYGLQAPSEVMPSARNAARRALELDSQVVEALTALAAVRGLYDWDWAGAERDFGRALEVQPTHAQTHQWLATHLLTPLRRFEEARGALAEAAALDPLAPVVAASRGIISLYAGETPRAVEELSHAAELYPEFGLARFFLGMAYQEAGDSGRAQEVLEQALELTNRSSEVLAALAHAQALASGQPSPAADELERRAADHYVSPALVAQVRLGMGDHEAALELLEAAADERSLDLVWLGVRPVYAPLRASPRFRMLLDRVGLGGG